MLKVTYSCYFAGKASWEDRKTRALLQPGVFVSRPLAPSSAAAFIPMPHASTASQSSRRC